MAKENTKKAKAAEEEYEEEEPETEMESEEEEEEQEQEEEEEASDDSEEDFRSRAKKSMKKKGGKPVKVEKKPKLVKKVSRNGSGTTKNGISRADWDTPWRPTSVLAQAFKLAQKGISFKDLTQLAKKNNCEASYVIGAMKREKTRNWGWSAKVSDTGVKILNAHSTGGKKKAA